MSLGFDHVVANMTFIPMAIWLDAPLITVGLYIWKGIVPALLGNIIGGGLFVGKCLFPNSIVLKVDSHESLGVYYWYMYLLGAELTTIDGIGNILPKNEKGSLKGKSDDLEAGGAVSNEVTCE